MQYAWHVTSVWTSLTFPTNNTQDLSNALISQRQIVQKKRTTGISVSHYFFDFQGLLFKFIFMCVCLCVHCICCFYYLLSFYPYFIFHYKHTLMTRMKICLVITISVSYNICVHVFAVYLFIYFFTRAVKRLIAHKIKLCVYIIYVGALCINISYM